MSVTAPEATPLSVPAPASEGAMLRAEDGDMSHAPAFLQLSAEDVPAEARRPRRRRAPKSFEGAEAPAED